MKQLPIRLMLFVLISFVIKKNTLAQNFPDKIYSDNIHGVQLALQGNQTGYPIIRLGEQNAMLLQFDDFDADVKSYYYTFQLCDANWNKPEISTFYYLKGFTQNRIRDYKHSNYAKTNYTHYQIALPQQNCMPIKSGNYLLKVFLNGDTSQLVFTRRFLIVDQKVSIAAQVQQPIENTKFLTGQKVQFSININKLQVSNPLQQIKVVVLQNDRWDNAKTNLQPTFMRGAVYEYNGERDASFQAGKEYRWADLRSFRFQSDRIASIDVHNTPFDVYLHTDLSRAATQYLPYNDNNGSFSITASEQINPAWQGDYAWVHFSFKPDNLLSFNQKNIYVLGQMNNYTFSKKNKMEYNPAKKQYEASLLLKQGFYNYMYATKDATQPQAVCTLSLTEGNYWETENNYTILVYYQSFSDRAPQLVGCKTINSRLK